MRVRVSKFYLLIICLFLVIGCASMFIGGGSLVPAGYKPQNILITYRAEGTVPAGVRYLLVQTEKGQGILERSPDGSGTLFQTIWRDEQGDHFAGWVVTSHGYEFVVPVDRSKPAKKYVYPKGSYSVKEINGISRPVPTTAIDPVAQLIPQ